MDLVFVVDTTASMTPAIGQMRSSMQGIVRILERLVPSLRVGIVAYSDRDTGREPLSILPLTSTDRDSNWRTCTEASGAVTVTGSAHFCRALPRYCCAVPAPAISRQSGSAAQQAKIDRCKTVMMPVTMVQFLSDR
jgi:hypothetical protein